MRTLVLGSGGRESALAWALNRSTSVTELVCAPGNPGTEGFAATLDVDIADPDAVVDAARLMAADLVVVGPEGPLVAGVADALRAAGVNVFGPDANAARIEGSKTHAKELMDRAGIRTARWSSFDSVDKAVAFADELGPPYVVKADGLAAGKGVIVTEDRETAVESIRDCLEKDRFGAAGATVVVEEFLDGEEVSLIALTDGDTVTPFEPAQDYKRAFDGDRGPNTGGMGCYSPVPVCPTEVAERIVHDVVEPMVAATRAGGAPFSGAIYAGLVLTAEGPRALEFNARFGDPETQALLPRLRSDFGELALACAGGNLPGAQLEWAEEVCVGVVLASGGYPGAYPTGLEISGLEAAAAVNGVEVFHAGTARRDGTIVTSGGRVLVVSALAPTFERARALAYDAAARIDFEGKHVREDIALKAQLSERSNA